MNNLVWLRNDLRVHDHEAFVQAFANLKTPESRVYALYCICAEQWDSHCVAEVRRYLVLKTLENLEGLLAAKGVNLIIKDSKHFDQSANDVLAVAQQLQCQQVFCAYEYPLNERRRDKRAFELLAENQIVLKAYHHSCLFAPGSIRKKDQSLYQVFTPFKKVALHNISLQPHWLMPATATWFQASDKAQARHYQTHNKHILRSYLQRYKNISTQQWLYNETQILTQLHNFCSHHLADYKQCRDIPSVPGTSCLSPYLSLGSLSPRTAYQQAVQCDGASEGFHTWVSELLWRDFYRHIIAYHPHISKGQCFKQQYNDLPWSAEQDVLMAWQEGMTGFPLVDAAMRQLNQTGWMHNRLRMLVAIFLSKYALLDWRLGEAYFMHKLVDGDFAANNGGWQWSASTGTDAVPYFRLLSPVRQAQRFDEQARFIKQFVPELRPFAAKDICNFKHELWLDSDYPQPIIELKGAKERAVAFFKAHAERRLNNANLDMH